MKRLVILLTGALGGSAPAATVLSNLTGPVSGIQIIAGPDLAPALEYGFEFSVPAGMDYQFGSLTLTFDSGGGPAPLEVELYASPSGPDAATLVSALSGPLTPGAGPAQWDAPATIALFGGQTYFVRFAVSLGPDGYWLEQTTGALSGPWSWEGSYTRSGGSPWAADGNAPARLSIDAAAVPEPAAAAGLFLAAACLIRRRRSSVFSE